MQILLDRIIRNGAGEIIRTDCACYGAEQRIAYILVHAPLEPILCWRWGCRTAAHSFVRRAVSPLRHQSERVGEPCGLAANIAVQVTVSCPVPKEIFACPPPQRR